ncbi:DNA-directed RNA polymerase I core subunit rpa12 [Mucor velutinosus]|uniref:DNA-directed RNA polymerase I core subunit rpa12 n=1 Tax=Mucor velutinosus TaxID=708070 RepID=A0AAN7DMT3_9FUNG|nr:DNA-directed RNA polymerase I core subunit rpa12 [Mucor velutinosus]
MKSCRILAEETKGQVYLYEFGGNWKHTITLKDILPVNESKTYSVCIKEARACPPEDCRCTAGYAPCMRALDDESHSSHTHTRDFIERTTSSSVLNPVHFELDEMKQCLQTSWEPSDQLTSARLWVIFLIHNEMQIYINCTDDLSAT